MNVCIREKMFALALKHERCFLKLVNQNMSGLGVISRGVPRLLHDVVEARYNDPEKFETKASWTFGTMDLG